MALVVAVVLGVVWIRQTGDDPRGSSPEPSDPRGPGLATSSVKPATERSTPPPPADPPLARQASPRRAPVLTHHVVDRNGGPVPGAEVQLLLSPAIYERPATSLVPGAWGAEEVERRTAHSDEAGAFTFAEDLAHRPGGLLIAVAPGYRAGSLLLPREEPWSAARRRIELEPCASYRVRVVDEAGAAVPDATVVHYGVPTRAPAEPEDFLSGRLREERRTDAQGRTAFGDAPGDDVFLATAGSRTSLPFRGTDPTDVTLTLRSSFTVGGTVRFLDEPAPGRPAPSVRIDGHRGPVARTLATRHAVGPGAFEPLSVPYLEGMRYFVRLEGGLVPHVIELRDVAPDDALRVELEARAGHTVRFVAVDAESNVIRASTARLHWREDGVRRELRARSDEEGLLELVGAPETSMYYEVSAPGYRTHYANAALVVPDHARSVITIPLTAPGVARGFVTHRGAPVTDFKLWAWHAEAASNHRVRVFTDRADGSFLWDDLPPGEVMLTACGVEGTSSLPATFLLTDTPSDPIRIELPEAFEATGRVVSALDGTPVAGARIDVNRRTSASTAFRTNRPRPSDAQGRFRIGGLGPGANYLSIHKEGFTSESTPVATEGDGVDLGDVLLWPNQSLTVELVGATPEAPPTSYQVSSGRGGPPIPFDDRGLAVFEGVRPGPEYVSVVSPRGEFTTYLLQMPPGRDHRVEHHVTTGRTLWIEPVATEGYDASAGFAAYVQTDAAGGMHVTRGLELAASGESPLRDVPGERVRVQLLRAGDWQVVGHASGSFDGNDELHLRVEAGAHRLAVRVVDVEGRPLRDVRVSFGQAAPPYLEVSDTTDEEGRAHLFVPRSAGQLFLDHEELGRSFQGSWPGGGGSRELVLRNDASIRLRIVEDGAPVRGVEAVLNWLQLRDVALGGTTDEDGQVTITGLTPGPFQLRLKRGGDWPTVVTVEASTDPEVRTVELASPGSLAIVLTEGTDPAGGVPLSLAGARGDVGTWIEAGFVEGSLVTDATGSVSLRGVPAGSYALTIDGAPSGTIEVPGGEHARYEITVGAR